MLLKILIVLRVILESSISSDHRRLGVSPLTKWTGYAYSQRKGNSMKKGKPEADRAPLSPFGQLAAVLS